MIAFAGAMRLQRNPDAAKHDYAFNVRPRWPLDELQADWTGLDSSICGVTSL
jgi:N6-L-threonylcarbamoyladenine synthase